MSGTLGSAGLTMVERESAWAAVSDSHRAEAANTGAAAAMGSEIMTKDEMKNLVGRRLAGRYKLTRYIDRGGFGAVFEAVDERLDGRIRAIKVGFDAKLERDFAKEAKLASNLDHPNVLQVFDYGIDSGLPYIVMEFLRGQNLETIFRENGKTLPRERLCRMVWQIGSALKRAHQHRLVHRDLKPRNIMLVSELDAADEDDSALSERFVLLDFGIASKLDANNTLANKTMAGCGTIEYMAPEQLGNPPGTPQADIYSFGVILYQMLCGQVPFPQLENTWNGMLQCAQAIAQDPPPRFAEVAPDRPVEPEIEELVLQCLSKCPEDRPQSMGEVRSRFLRAYAPPQLMSTSGGSTRRPGEIALLTQVPTGDTKPSWHGQTLPGSRRVPPVIWSLLPVLFLLALAVAWWPKPEPWSLSLIPPKVGFEGSAHPPVLTVEAGSEASFFLHFEGLDAKQSPISLSLQQSGATDKIRVIEPKAPYSDAPVVTVQVPDVNTHGGTESELVIIATHSSSTHKLKLTVRVAPPANIWPPPKGFTVPPDTKLVKVGDRVFYERLVREILAEDKALHVGFRLIPGDEDRDYAVGQVVRRTIQVGTFYMMEHKVWNSLFRRFKSETDGKWVAKEDRAGTVEMLPVGNVTLLEAHRCAEWIANGHGRLPSCDEWDAAAGYHDWLNQPAPEPGVGPFRSPEDKPLPELPPNQWSVGSQPTEVSPYGIWDMSSNGLEWTRSLGEFHNWSPGESSSESLYLRGRLAEEGRLYFLEDSKRWYDGYGLFGMNPADVPAPNLGFRVVLPVRSTGDPENRP